jgi:hypothetical protein
MPKYEVTVTETTTYPLPIFRADEATAREDAIAAVRDGVLDDQVDIPDGITTYSATVRRL